MDFITENGMISLNINNKKTVYVLLLLILIGLNIHCKKEIKYITVYPTDINWKSANNQYDFGADLLYLDAHVSQNQLKLITPFTYEVFNADGLRSTGTEFPFQIIENKPVFGNGFLVLPVNKVYSGRTDLRVFFDSYSYDFFLFPQFKDKLNYFGINTQNEVAAVNNNDRIMSSLISTIDSTRIYLILFNIENAYFDTTNYNTLFLPIEAGIKVTKMKGLHKNFIISSTSQTYAITPDGNYKKIFDMPVRDVFVHNGSCYAEVGKSIYKSDDDGINWTLIVRDTRYIYQRNFTSAANNLFFFKEDSIFKVNPVDFSYTNIDNSGFKGNKVVQICYFIDNIYVVTNNGTFYKSRINVLPQ